MTSILDRVQFYQLTVFLGAPHPLNPILRGAFAGEVGANNLLPISRRRIVPNWRSPQLSNSRIDG